MKQTTVQYSTYPVGARCDECVEAVEVQRIDGEDVGAVPEVVVIAVV